MRYVVRTIALLSLLPLFSTGCSLRILGVNKNDLTADSGIDVGNGANNGINSFSVLGASGGSDTTADTYLTDGTIVTATWVDTTGEDSYEVKILDQAGSTTLCGPSIAAADSTSHTISGCSLSHGVTYRIQVTAKNSVSGAAQTAYSNFQVGPFITVSDVSVNEWGIATIPVSLSYAVGSAVSLQYVTADSSATSGADYIHSSLSTLTIPAGQTSAVISVPLLTDREVESSEHFRVELSSASGAGLLSTGAQITVQDDDLSPASGFSQVFGGGSHSCALTSSGGVKCWGSNVAGQLGDNSTTQRLVPTDALGLSSGITQIAAGAGHTCALTSSGAVKCWGGNSFGHLGNNSTTNSLVPTDVLGLSSGMTQIAAGNNHACALSSSGAVKCWGYNVSGQLGDNSNTNRLVPIDVSGLSSGIAQIAGGGNYTCALTTSGGVKCWGNNVFGQIGDNSTVNRYVPTDVFGLSSGIVQIATGGSQTCALSSMGAVKCWGDNSFGQLGDNSTAQRLVPTDVFGLSSGISQITAGLSHSCALTSMGAVKCWGSNASGQLGDNSTTVRLVPTDVLGLSSGITQIAAGNNHTCARTSSGTIQCWGDNNSGQRGDNSMNGIPVPTDVFGLSSGISQIATGGNHTCALTSSGTVKCWGNNSFGQLGDNSTTHRPLPYDVFGLSSGTSQIATGGNHTCALTSSGTVKCWGVNSYGQLGDNSTTVRLVPTDVIGLPSGIVQIAAGGNHACALASTGAVKCWGLNTWGQIGDNSTTQRLIPTDTSGLASGITQITAGNSHTCALSSLGGVKCWGVNSFGQLGNNSTTNRLVPTDVIGLPSGISQITAGDFHTCALSSMGAVKCWGRNDWGQLGDNSGILRLVPTDVLGLSSGVTQVVTGFGHSCALSTMGVVKCWGMNSAGQLGDNSTTQRLAPTNASGLASGITQITAGNSHTCALSSMGAVKCWGYNYNGQVGDSYSNIVPHFVVSP